MEYIEMYFQGSEYRKRLLPIDFFVCFYLPREQQQMEDFSFLSNLVHLSLDILGNVTLAMLMFRMFTQSHNFMEVEYLLVVSPLENQKENAVHFAKRTGHAIATALNVVQTGHAYGDFMLFAKAAESKQENPTLYMIEMKKVESTFHLSSLEAMDFLDTFLSMNPDSSGHVKIHDFSRVMRLKACGLSEKIFGILDVEKRGKITFKQFVYGLAHVLKQPLFRQACELAFTECHAHGNHYISEQELGDSINQAIPNLNQYEISKDDFSTCLRRNPLLIALFSPKLIHKNLSEGGDKMLKEIV
ncbi:hypothetical protein ACSBR2_004783 [Camellia fascicularis]